MFGLGRKQTPLLGIDIGSTAVKLVELSRPGASATGHYQVDRYAIEPLPPNAMAEKKIADAEMVGQTVGRVLRRAETKNKRAALAISGSAVITKTITMSGELSESDMEAQLQLDADQYIPFPLEEVNIDFDVLGPSTANPGMVDVLLVASRRENIDDRLAALAVAGLTAEIVDVETYAMENACVLMLEEDADARREETVAVADIGAATTTLYVLNKGQIVYTREQKFGGLQLINDIQHRLDVPREQAAAKLINGELPEDYESQVLAPFKEAMSQQIGRALQFFYSATAYDRADRILLTGGVASLPGLDQLVGERLGIAAGVGDPFRHMSLSKELADTALKRDAPALVIAVGLALRGFA